MKVVLIIELKNKLCSEIKKFFLIAFTFFLITYSAFSQTDGSNLEPTYDSKKNGYGYVDRASGKKVIPFKFRSAKEFNDGAAIVLTKSGFGLINTMGETLLPFEYGSINLVRCPEVDYILEKRVNNNQSQHVYGIADAHGRIILPCEYNKIEQKGGTTHSAGVFTVEKQLNPASMGLGIVNSKGEFIAPPNAKNFPAPNFYWGADRVALEKDGQVKFGAVSNQGEVVIPFDYKDMFVNPELIVATDFNLKCHIFSISGRKLSDIAYDEFGNKGSYNLLSDNNIRVKKDGKYGLFGKNGLIVPCEYDEIPDGFNDGFITVKIDKKCGVVNSNGKLVVPCEYEAAFHYYETKLLYVYRDNKRGYYNLSGKMILPCEFKAIPDSLVGGCFILPKDGKYGMIDTTAKVIVPFVLDEGFVNSKPEQALTYCKNILSINPTNKDIIYLMARAYYVSRKPEAAVNELTAMINSNNAQITFLKIPGVYYYRTLAYLKMGDLGKAIQDGLYTCSSDEKEWSCKAYSEIANAEFKLGKYREALSDCWSAIRYSGRCAEALQLEAAIKSEMIAKGIPLEQKSALLTLAVSKRNIYYIGDDRKKFPSNWPENFYWNPSEQIKGKYSDRKYNCELSNFNPNYAGHDNNYFDLHITTYVDSRDLFGNFTGYALETNAAYFLKSIERLDNGQYIFYAERSDGPISYNNGLQIFYKSQDDISFSLLIKNELYEMKKSKMY